MFKRILALLLVVAVVGAGIFYFISRDDGEEDVNQSADDLSDDDRSFSTNDPVERGCALPLEIVERIDRGTVPEHSENLMYVPQEPNYVGAFSIRSHSGPWDYVQTIPLVFYGPKRIVAQGDPLDKHVSITDVYGTVGELTNVDLPPRKGTVLTDALKPGVEGVPKVIVTIVWDGAGRNVLERWPDAWPNLARMEREGTSYLRATVGSSPSITPATHSSLGTGSFPKQHDVTAIAMRKEGSISEAFLGRDPSDLKLTTFADEIDQFYDNASVVGMLAWKSWHLGMLGHGSQIPGGDQDLLGLIGHDELLTGNPEFYYTPTYLHPLPGLAERLEAADREDGEADGLWMGHDIELHENSGWVKYMGDALLTTIRNEGFGADDVPDLLFTNLKMTDIVGHQYSMDAPEEREVLAAQDAVLGKIVRYLDKNVGDYVVILTADHGHTPSTEVTGAWPIAKGALGADINNFLDVSEEDSPILNSSAVGMFMDPDKLAATNKTLEDIATFLNDYTVKDNWDEDELPPGYDGRANEQVFSAVFATSQLPEILTCARSRDE